MHHTPIQLYSILKAFILKECPSKLMEKNLMIY